MSGICAVWRRGNPAAAGGELQTMAEAMRLDPAAAVRRCDAGEAGVAVTTRSETASVYRSGHLAVACDSDLVAQEQTTASTAELITDLYRIYGREFASRLRGGFAAIIWDERTRELVLAVDGFGIKRLAYTQDSGGFRAATRADALARVADGGGVDPRAIANILNFSSNLSPGTIWRNIHRLEPGSVLVASAGGVRIDRYWDMRYPANGGGGEARLAHELSAVVEESVGAYAKVASPSRAGAFLSGGTDSSTVVGMMSRGPYASVPAFSIGFEEQPFNELEYAKLAARCFGAEHHTYLVGPDDCFDALPNMVRYFDEPFGNSSAIPTYFCARLAKQHGVDVMLAGDGGDELFAGNEWYASDRVFDFYQRVPRLLRKALIEPVLGAVPLDGIFEKARRYVRRSNLPPLERVMSYGFLRASAPRDVFSDGFLGELGDYDVLGIPAQHYSEAEARDHLNRLLYVDLKIVIADSDLPKVTWMCELAGIRPRFPFLDRRVAEFSGTIPESLKVKGMEKRYLFKRAFRDLLPKEIIQKKKHGFGIPVSTWLKTDRRLREMARDTLLSQRAHERGYFRRDFINNLFEQHEQDDTAYYGDTLWTFLVLELWHRQYVDEPARVTA